MTKPKPPFDSVLGPLLERARIIPPVASAVRARSLARARASLASTGVVPSAPRVSKGRRALPIALAASIALVAGAAGAFAALRARVPRAPVPPPPVEPVTPSAARSTPGPSPEAPAASPATAAPARAVVKPQRPGRAVPAQDSYEAELELLQRAQAAYADRSFPSSLGLVDEHGRRFPNGRLAEEREALRVRSLRGSGRAEEATRAAAAFADRFPRSVLLPRLGTKP